MKIFGFAGWSGSGKTTLLKQLIPTLVNRGLKVSTLKHAHHRFDVDKPGKDSYEHREAGASEVMISSGNRWALMHELRDEKEPTLEELIPHMSPVDLLLVEGFKRESHQKLEIYRPSVGKRMLHLDDPQIIAIATDEPFSDTQLPVLDLNDPEAIADFICMTCELDKQIRKAAD
ncbi:molybdopterin-guanine dinucleotide biosynthesis protein B [Kiloniella laminariae]|uniref:molybdopterin-guanine dinucleotide biosynthesis protein B n=1 Tax=Kiloniella laminariae TaxID=454162 RepID=UPI00036C8159|nr:molybdopterin-guanine dinucleotide biosynthesis protein B [Kiloniella laminariae]